MASEGPRYPGTLADDNAIGVITWSNTANAGADDGSFATADSGVAPGDQITHYLKVTNFGFTIPAGSTIVGITVEVEGKHVNDLDSDSTTSVKLVKADGTLGTGTKTGGSWTTSDVIYTFGSASDLWSDTWTAADINDADFGVAFSRTIARESGAASTISSVDYIRITVTYSATAGKASFFL